MTQTQAIILAFRATEVAAVASIIAFVAYYTYLAPWWRDPIGRTIVAKDLALVLALIPGILSIFLHMSRSTSYVVAWIDVGMLAAITGVMAWRIAVWHQIHKKNQRPGRQDGS